jgi:ABC-type branched-subunit amino acid transport system ATPase component/ABC-type branched-subunit amino acid transport system permease subunit
MELSIETVLIGLLTGLAYALLGTGLVLIYRGARVINFAHGQMGALAAALLVRLVLNYRWNYFLALAAAIVVGAGIGAGVELAVIRRLFKAPRLVVLIATIGVAQLLLVLEYLLPAVPQQSRYPSPLDRTIEVGSLVLHSGHFMVLAFVPAAVAGLSLFLTRTPTGTAIRAAAENPDTATLVGVSAKRVSLVVWALAGALAALTAVLIAPIRPSSLGSPVEALGPGLFLRALTAALVGRMVSIPWTLAGGVAIGIVEALMFVNVRTPGAVEALLFVAILGLLLRRGTGRADDGEAWSLTPKVLPPPAAFENLWWVRRMPQLVGAGALLVAVVLPWIFTSSGDIFLFSRVLVYGMIVLSVSVLIGWAGQLSLGQFAFVGLGALGAAALADYGMPFMPSVVYITLAGALVAVLIGFPAVRVRGLFLAVATLAFSLAAADYFFRRPLFLGGESFATVRRGSLFGIDLSSQRAYFYLILVVFVAVVSSVSRLRRTGVGRSMIAVRDNDNGAASFGIAPAATKLTAFALAGGIAALAGALLGGLRGQFSPADFGPSDSLAVVSMAIIGGLGSVAGAVIGALYVVGLPALFGNSVEVSLMTSSIGLLVLLLYFPGGLVQVGYSMRDALFRRLARDMPVPESSGRSSIEMVERIARNTGRDDIAYAEVPLRCTDVTVRFGGLMAVNGASIEVHDGEIVGLIGSNGAGKSTLMNAISGFVPVASGTVELLGTDVTDKPPHERARLGTGRVFQDARLFPDLTVRETVLVALESREHSEVVPALLGLPPSRRAEAAKRAESEEYLAFLGLGRYADVFVSSLSTGTRRIVEMTCLLAQGSRLLLLDEPMAGIAQREAEAFAPLIRRIKDELGASILVIEHDMPLVMAISDRIYCMSAGVQIAHGKPDEVRTDPKVIAAYLGTDERAIQRSGRLGKARRRRPVTEEELSPL